MKQSGKATVAAVAGLAGLVMIASQSLASGDHGVATADGADRLAPMSQGGGMRHGMMHHRMMGQGGKGHGMMMRGGGHGFGRPIRPMTHLSVEDVRHALEHRLERRGNKRLKLGDVKTTDDDTIVADIVTLDDSLVRRLAVDRHTGRVRYRE